MQNSNSSHIFRTGIYHTPAIDVVRDMFGSAAKNVFVLDGEICVDLQCPHGESAGGIVIQQSLARHAGWSSQELIDQQSQAFFLDEYCKVHSDSTEQYSFFDVKNRGGGNGSLRRAIAIYNILTCGPTDALAQTGYYESYYEQVRRLTLVQASHEQLPRIDPVIEELDNSRRMMVSELKRKYDHDYARAGDEYLQAIACADDDFRREMRKIRYELEARKKRREEEAKKIHDDTVARLHAEYNAQVADVYNMSTT